MSIEIHPLRRAVIEEALSWKGTDFRHKARVKGVGVDCLSMVWAVGEACEVMAHVTKSDARPFWRFYGRRPDPPVMRACLAKFLRPLSAGEQPKPGDIAWMHWGNEMPIHMAIIGLDRHGNTTLIHSVWNMGVIDHGFTSEFRERVTCYWRYPVIAEAEAA